MRCVGKDDVMGRGRALGCAFGGFSGVAYSLRGVAGIRWCYEYGYGWKGCSG